MCTVGPIYYAPPRNITTRYRVGGREGRIGEEGRGWDCFRVSSPNKEKDNLVDHRYFYCGYVDTMVLVGSQQACMYDAARAEEGRERAGVDGGHAERESR